MAISLVQHGSNTGTITSGTTLTVAVTLGANITAGNTLVAFAGLAVGNTGGVVSSTFNTNGSADNWQYITGLVGNFTDWPYQLAMVDPVSAGGTTVVNFTATVNTAATTSGTVTALVDVFEVAGLGPGAAIDRWTVSDPAPTGTTWTSGSSPAGWPAQQVILLGAVHFGVSATNTTATLTGPASGWTNETALHSTLQEGGTGTANLFNLYQLSGFWVSGNGGGPLLAYSGTSTQTGNYVSWGVSLYNGAAPFFPAVKAIQAKRPPGSQRIPGPGPRGRVTSNPGGPVRNLQPGPVFYPLRWPARVHPVLPPRGRAQRNPGAPVRNPQPGPVFRQAVRPIRAPVPQTFSKGRTQSTPPYRHPPYPANPIAVGLTLTAGGFNAWQYIGQYPVTYLQYMQPDPDLILDEGGNLILDEGGNPILDEGVQPTPVLQPSPGQIFTVLGPASGYPYQLPVPPPDGRWVLIGGGGTVFDFLHYREEEVPLDDGLAWNPPPHLAHLPVPFSVIAERIRKQQQRRANE